MGDGLFYLLYIYNIHILQVSFSLSSTSFILQQNSNHHTILDSATWQTNIYTSLIFFAKETYFHSGF